MEPTGTNIDMFHSKTFFAVTRSAGNKKGRRELGIHCFSRVAFLLVKGPAADATDAPQPSGSLFHPVMKMIIFFVFFHVIDRGKLK
jgi:hypothetical protein